MPDNGHTWGGRCRFFAALQRMLELGIGFSNEFIRWSSCRSATGVRTQNDNHQSYAGVVCIVVDNRACLVVAGSFFAVLHRPFKQ